MLSNSDGESFPQVWKGYFREKDALIGSFSHLGFIGGLLGLAHARKLKNREILVAIAWIIKFVATQSLTRKPEEAGSAAITHFFSLIGADLHMPRNS